MIDRLLDQGREEPVAITAALRGAGGYGKTTLAKALCHDERIQQAFDDGILWVTLGENPGNLVGKVEDLIYMLHKERPSFTSITRQQHDSRNCWPTVTSCSSLTMSGTKCTSSHFCKVVTLRPLDYHAQRGCSSRQYQKPGRRCYAVRRGITLLGAGIERSGQLANERALRLLSARLGEWPLLLKLVNGTLRERVSRNQSLPEALAYVNEALDECGLTVFDARNAQDAVSGHQNTQCELPTLNSGGIRPLHGVSDLSRGYRYPTRNP